MFTRTTTHLSPSESFGCILFIITIMIIVFWVIPNIRRSDETSTPEFSCRVYAVFGSLFTTGGLYRISLYGDSFVTVFLGLTRFSYDDVQDLSFSVDGIPKLTMKLHGVHVKCYGDTISLKKLHSELTIRQSDSS